MVSFDENIGKRLVPKIYLFSSKSFKVWSNLRSISMDFGKQYFEKHYSNTQDFFWVGIFSVFGIWATFFIQLGTPSQTVRINLRKIQFTLNMVCILLFLMYFTNLAKIVQLNKSSMRFQEHLRLLKSNLEELMTLMRGGLERTGDKLE